VNFHSLLELLTIDNLKNKYIDFVLQIERYLNEGNYQQVLQSKMKSPLPAFHFFLDRIIETIRFALFDK